MLQIQTRVQNLLQEFKCKNNGRQQINFKRVSPSYNVLESYNTKDETPKTHNGDKAFKTHKITREEYNHINGSHNKCNQCLIF